MADKGVQRMEWSDAVLEYHTTGRITSTALNVALRVAKYIDWWTEKDPTVSELKMSNEDAGAYIGLDRKTVGLAGRELVAAGLIEMRVSRGHRNWFPVIPTDQQEVKQGDLRRREAYREKRDARKQAKDAQQKPTEAPVTNAEPEPVPEEAPAPVKATQPAGRSARNTTGLITWDEEPKVQYDGGTNSYRNNDELDALNPDEAREAFKETVPAKDRKVPSPLDGW